MNTKIRLGLLIASLALSTSPVARAAVPPRFSVEGVLRDDSGKLQTLAVDVTVTFYDAQSSGNVIAGPWGPTTTMAQNGFFSLAIEDASLKAALNTATSAWMEVQVGSTIFSRQQINAQLYALSAASAEQADGLSTACSGCVDDPMIKAVDGSKVTGKVPAAANADAVTNGLYATGMYTDPSWLVSLSGAKITGQVASAASADNATTAATATTVVNGLYSTMLYSDPSWLLSLSGAKITGQVASAMSADSVTNGLYASEMYSDPSWLLSLSGGKITGQVASAASADNAAQLGGLPAASYAQAQKSPCADGTFLTNLGADGTATCAGPSVTYGYNASSLTPALSGAVAHLDLVAPSNGFVLVTATFDVSADNAGADCTVGSQVAAAAAQPSPGAGFQQLSLPSSIATRSMGGALLSSNASIATLVAVTAGANSIFLNGASSCGSASWSNVNLSAVFVPAATSGMLAAN